MNLEYKYDYISGHVTVQPKYKDRILNSSYEIIIIFRNKVLPYNLNIKTVRI